jgi:plasmid stability protein
MAGMIQIRNVPDELHRRLKARAALAGQSLSDYLLAEIRRSAALPTRAEIIDRLRRLPRVKVPESAAEALDAVRAGRDDQLAAPRTARRGRR